MSRVSLLSDLLESIGARSWFAGDPLDHPFSLTDLAGLCHSLVSSRGEASGVRLAAEILSGYRCLDQDASRAFFHMLAEEFMPDEARLRDAAAAYASEPSPATLSRLQILADPPRQELLRRLNLAPGGTAELVKMRERLLECMKEDEADTLKVVDTDFRHLFQSWFNRGFLMLRPIDWDTPASILERIIRYEAVHAIGNWDELRQRLAPADRRCFGFFHPSIPDDPLIFVEVALTDEIPATIASLLDSDRALISPSEAQTAVFYSISNCHRGLAGVSFGSFLIKQVATDLKETIPNLRSFVTLSPAPLFARWLRELPPETVKSFEPAERQAREIVSQRGWEKDAEKVETARPGLLSLAARYFLNAKNGGGLPLDPVARFHLGNGALLNRIMHLGDRSASAMANSHGIMVNYLYELPRVEQRHEAFVSDAEVAAARAVTSLATKRPGRNSMKDVA